MKDALGARVVRAIPENTIYAFSRT